MLAFYHSRCRFLLVLLLHLLVDGRLTANVTGSLNNSAYIVNSSKDLFLSDNGRNASSSGYTRSSVQKLHNPSSMQTTLTFTAMFLLGGNSTVFPHPKSTDKYQSDLQSSIRKTESVHDTESDSSNRTTSTEYPQKVSMTELYSNKIVTAPISSTVNRNFSSVKISPTEMVELVSSMYKNASNATAMKSLSNSTKILSQPDATKTKGKVSSVSTLRTSEYPRETSKLLPSPASTIYARPIRTNVANTSIILESTVQLKNKTSSANLSEYSKRSYSPIVLPNSAASPRLSFTNLLSHSTVDMRNKSSVGPSDFLLPSVTRGIGSMNFTTTSLFSNLNSTSETILSHSSIQKAERKIATTTISVSKNSSVASQSQSDASKNISSYVKVTILPTTLEGNSGDSEHYGSNATYTSRIRLEKSSAVLNASSTNIQFSSFTRVPSFNTNMWTAHSSKSFYTLPLAPSTRRNIFKNSTIETGYVSASVSRHPNTTSRVNGTAAIYSTSPLPTLTSFSEQALKNTTIPSLLDGNHTTELMFSESTLLIKSTTKTNSSAHVTSLDNNIGNVSSSKSFYASTSSDVFRRSTVAADNVCTSVSRHPNRTSRVNSTIVVYSTSPLPTLTLLSEQIPKNTTTSLLLEGNRTTELMFSKSIYSTTERMSSMSFEDENTTMSKSNSTAAFLGSISPSYNASADMKPFTSFPSKGQIPATKSKVILTQSRTNNLSSSILVSNHPTPVVLITVSSEFKNLTSFPSKTVSTNNSLSILTRLKSNTPFRSKSLLSMHIQVDQSRTTVSNYVQVSGKNFSDITNVLQTTNPVSYTIVRSLSSLLQTTSLSVPVRFLKIDSVSLVPIYTSCYISYMVTVSRRVKLSLVTSVVDFETGITSTIEKPSFVPHLSRQSLTHSSPLQPTPSTRFLHLNSSTEMYSKSPTQSLSRLPVHSVESMYNATTAKHNTHSVTMKTSHYTRKQNFTYSDSSVSNVLMSSFGLHESTVSSNLRPNLRNHTTFLNDHLRSSLVKSTPVQNPSLKILNSINTSFFSITSRSVDKYDDFTVSSTTITNFIPVTSIFPMFTEDLSSNSIGRSLILSYSVPAESKQLNRTSATKAMTTHPTMHGQSLNSDSNSLSKGIVNSSGVISRSFSGNETPENTRTNPPALSSKLSAAQKMSLSTSFTKQIRQSNFQTVNNSYLQASPSLPELLTFRDSSQSVVPSSNIEATLSLNHMLHNGSNRTTKSYFKKRNTTVQLLPSSLSFKLTTFQSFGTPKSTLANMTILENKIKSIRNQNQNSAQSTPVLSRTPSPTLSHTGNSATTTNLNIPANFTLLPSNMSVLSDKLSSTRFFLIKPSLTVASGHITDANSVGAQNVSLIATETIPTEGIQPNITKAIGPSEVFNTGSVLKTLRTSHKNDPISNSSLIQAISSYASLNATPSFSAISEVEAKSLHRKRRDLRNLNFTKTPTVNISMLAVSASSWKTVSVRTVVVNGTIATPTPLAFNSSNLEKLSITSALNLPSSQAANKSRLLADDDISTNMPAASAETKHSNKFVVPKPSSVASGSTVRNLSVDETYLLSKNFTLIVSSASYLIRESRPLINISSLGSLSRGITSEPHNTSIAEDPDRRFFNRRNLTQTSTQQQPKVITKSTLSHHSGLLIPSTTKDTKGVYINRTITKSTIASTSLIADKIKNASSVDHSSLISTNKPASRPNITSIPQRYTAKENASESILNTSMSTSINIGKGSILPTIQDSSYTSTTQYNSNSTVLSISETATHAFKSYTNTISPQIMESLVSNSTTKMALTQTLVRASLYPIDSLPSNSQHHSVGTRTETLVNLTISRDISHEVFSQSSKNITSLTAPSSMPTYFSDGTSSVRKSISFASSTILNQYIRITPSPSPSFSITGSIAMTLTSTLPERNYSSFETILEQSSFLRTTDRGHGFTVNTSVTSAGESNAVLSPIMETKSESKAVVRSTKQSAGYFTYHVTPTSSLGLCLVSYSTVFINNSRQSPGTRTSTSLLNWTATVQTSAVSSLGKINSTGILTSATLTRFNTSSTTLLYSSLNGTSTLVKSSVYGSYVVNKSSILSASRSQNLVSAVSTMLLKISISSSLKGTPILNVSYPGQSLSKNMGNVSSPSQLFTMSHSKSLSLHALRTDISTLPSPTLALTTSFGKSSIHSQLLDTESYIATATIAASMSPHKFLTSTVYQILPTLSSIVAPSSVAATTHAPTSTVDENLMLLIVLAINESVNVSTSAFKTDMEEKLNKIYQTGQFVQGQRRRRSTASNSRVEVQDIRRNIRPQEVYVEYIVIENNKTLTAENASKTMNAITAEEMSRIIGYDVLSRPRPVQTIVPRNQDVAMIVTSDSQKNLSNIATKNDFENKLASFYKNLTANAKVKAAVTQLYHEPLGRTYIEFVIIVNNDAVNRTRVRNTFDVSVKALSMALNQTVVVAPYIPDELYPVQTDYIIQNMQFDNVRNLQGITKDISDKLTRVYVKAQLKGPQKRRKRALGSINAMVEYAVWTEGYSADVTYYITDAGSVLNATYACSILKRLSLQEMSSVTTPFTVNTTPRPLQSATNTTPRPLQSTTSETSDDDEEYPSWFIPVVVAGSVGLVLLVVVIILYCRWKKGAPAKKILPQTGSPIEEQVQKPRMTHASEPEAKPTLRRPPPTPRLAVTVEENGESEPQPRTTSRKLPVREGSMRRKVLGKESISTRTNPAFDEGESEDESVMDVNVSRRAETLVVGRRTHLEIPRKTIPPPSLSEEDDESEGSEDESVNSAKESVFTEHTNQNSAGTLPPVAVMSDPRPPEIQPPVRFRQTVHPEPSLPPLDMKQTSLVGRVIEEEGSVQKEIKTKADIERWRNKQRQREKRLGGSVSKSGNKRPSFTEKKAWGRAQKEIGAVLDPETMQPIVRKPRRKPRRKYRIKADTSDEENNVELRGFKKLTSPREEKVPKTEPESQSDSDISMGEARRRMIALIDDAFTSIKSASKKHHPEATDQVDAGGKPQTYPQSKTPPPLYPRPATLTPALPEPPPPHGRASVPSARHRRRFMNSQNSLPYPSQYYPGMSGGFSPRYPPPPPPPPPVVTKNPLVVWDPADKQRMLNQSAYRPYGRHPYSYTDPSGKLHFTPVQQTPDGMGGLVWSPYTTEYAMEDFYRNMQMPGTLDHNNASFMSKMPETPVDTVTESPNVQRDAVIDMPDAGEPSTRSGESAEPLVRAIKDELFRLASGRTPVKHL